MGASVLVQAGSSGMGRTMLPVGLAVVAVVQIAMLGRPNSEAAVPAASLAAGDVVPGLRVRHANGEEKRLGSGGDVLVLVFDPRCAHSRRAAPAWREWMREARGLEVDVVALSAAAPSLSAAHAKASGWHVPVVAVDASMPGSLERALTKRTPWVFALDATGTVLAQGHGIRFSEVASALAWTERAANDHHVRPRPVERRLNIR